MKLRRIRHMQSHGIALPEAALDQSTSEQFDFSSQSFASPCFFVFEERNFLSICCGTMTKSSCRYHSHSHFQAASTYLQATPSFHIPFLTNSEARVSGSQYCYTDLRGVERARRPVQCGKLKPVKRVAAPELEWKPIQWLPTTPTYFAAH